MKLSIVATLYHSAQYIEEFCRRSEAVASKLVNEEYEIILVNDGSPDNSLDVALKLHTNNYHIKILDLSRNFGHHRAMMCGIEHAQGDRVFLIDVDLEEEPENLTRFWVAMDEDPEIDVIVGELTEKTVPYFKKTSSSLFYKIFNALSSVKISDREIVSRLMNRAYVNALTEYDEREIFFPAIWVDAGFKQKTMTAAKTFDGHSTYTFRKKLVMAIDAITSFSSKPLIYIFYIGLSFSIGSLLFIIYLVMRKLLLEQVFLGWTSLMAVICLIGGIIIFSLGVVGIYISKIYIEVKARPNSIVRKFYQGYTNH